MTTDTFCLADCVVYATLIYLPLTFTLMENF